MSILGFGSKVSKEITKTSVKNADEVKRVAEALEATINAEDKVKVLKAGVNDNRGNPALMKLIADMGENSPIGKVVNELKDKNLNDPTVKLLEKANDYKPSEPKNIRINTNNGVKSFIPNDLSPKDVNSILRLFGEKKLWNKNLGLSVGDVNTYTPDGVIDSYNRAIKNPEVSKLLEGKLIDRDLVWKSIYNFLASASWGSAGHDMADVFYRFNGNSENGNSDSIWKNPNALGITAAAARAAFPLAKLVTKIPFNSNTLGKVADLFVPAALAKGVKYATTPNEVVNNPSNTYPNTNNVDALNNSNKGNTSLAVDLWD